MMSNDDDAVHTTEDVIDTTLAVNVKVSQSPRSYLNCTVIESGKLLAGLLIEDSSTQSQTVEKPIGTRCFRILSRVESCAPVCRLWYQFQLEALVGGARKTTLLFVWLDG